MSTECENMPNCGFFKKYQETKSLVCEGFVVQFCKGPKQGECKRKAYKKEHGTPPPDDMMPSGQIIHIG